MDRSISPPRKASRRDMIFAGTSALAAAGLISIASVKPAEAANGLDVLSRIA